ncbi:hypothetical protein AQUCO_00600337v1, partial [Aquilegia coerulea]
LTRDAPPTHFILKIESFSSLASTTLKRYESCEFDAGDYKWRLALYPNGDQNRDYGKDHISLYLVLDKSCRNLKKEISVTFSLFVYDNIRDKYLSVQGVSCFNAMRSLNLFNSPSNGYIISNTCIFGAEVFVIDKTAKGQCLSMVACKPDSYNKFIIWKIENFSALEDKWYSSEMLKVEGYYWKIGLAPKGEATGKGTSLSLYLHSDDANSSVPAGTVVVAEYKLRVVNQINGNHKEFVSTASFSASNRAMGKHQFLDLSNLNKSTGYLVNDTCIVEAEVCVLGSAKTCI